MSLYDKRIPVKGRFVKETSGYREADVQQFLHKLKQRFSEKDMKGITKFLHNVIDNLAGKELAFANVGSHE